MASIVVCFVLACVCFLIMGLLIGHNPDSNAPIPFVIAGAILIVAVYAQVDTVFAPKRECEAELPRNVECVWMAPPELPQEGVE